MKERSKVLLWLWKSKVLLLGTEKDHFSRLKSWRKKYTPDKKKSLFLLSHYIPRSCCARCF